MDPQRLNLRVAPATPEQLVQRLVQAAERLGISVVIGPGGEVWDPALLLIEADALPLGKPLQDPGMFERRLVVAIEGATELPDDIYWELRRHGATEVIDVAAEKVDREVRRLQLRLHRWTAVDRALTSVRVADVLVGRSPVWMRAMRLLVETAKCGEQPVLIRGETGTGKEAAARLVHDLGSQACGPFVVVDCASIVETLSGSELFGHRRGAFTGADRDREGAVQRANGGTLFLDELGELKPALQAELLRVLQEGIWRPVGDDRPRQSKFRLVAATNRDLCEMVRQGSFRADLYHRIAGTTVTLPALRERREDIPILVRHFLRELLPDQSPITVDDRLMRHLVRMPLDGNVRQLRAIIQAVAAQVGDGDTAGPGHLPVEFVPRSSNDPNAWSAEGLRQVVEQAVQSGATFRSIVETCKEAACVAALRMGGSASKAARMLAVSTRLVEKRRRPDQEPRLKIAS